MSNVDIVEYLKSLGLLAVPLIIGVIWLNSFALVALQGIYARLFRPGKNIKKAFGEWAVVTGGKVNYFEGDR
jgi:hypothetical protein